MEVKVIQQFFPDLISVVGTCVQNVSDHCFSKGLIEETTQRKIVELAGTDTERARTLILAVRASIARNSKSFTLFMNVLEKVLPSVDEPLLNAMKTAVTSCTSEVIDSQIPSLPHSQIACGLSDSKTLDTCQLQPSTSEPSSGSDFIGNGHYDQAIKGAKESDSTISESATSEYTTTDVPKTRICIALESSESSHNEVTDDVITSADGTHVPKQPHIPHLQGEEAVESAMLSKMTQTSKQHHDSDNGTVVQVQRENQVKLHQDFEVCCTCMYALPAIIIIIKAHMYNNC